MNRYLMFFVCCLFVFPMFVFADTFEQFEPLDTTPNSITDYLIDYAYANIPNFTNMGFAVFKSFQSGSQVRYTLVASTNYDTSFSDRFYKFFKPYFLVYDSDWCNQQYVGCLGGNTQLRYYDQINVNVMRWTNIISNLGNYGSISSSKFDNYKFNKDMRNIGIFILGLVFAIFLTKERRY